MGGFTFCCGDMGPVMEAKGTVTNEILEMIEDDPRVCYINADGTGRGGRVQQAQLRYPDRILDVGIQEMNMVTIAAGLAKEGFLPYVQTFGPFLCVRALDQIHNDVAYNDYPVRLIGTHAGLSSGYGPTHNTIIEFGVMNSLPNMTMVAPCDAEQCKKLLRKSLNYPKPIYIRIPRGEEPLVYAADHDYDYEIGKAIDELIVHGQINGGILQSLGYGSMEKLEVKGGRFKQKSMSDYVIPTSMDFPKQFYHIQENPYPWGPYGAKGMGELVFNGASAAYVDAGSTRALHPFPSRRKRLRRL